MRQGSREVKKPTPKIELVKSTLWLGLKILTARRVTYARCPRCRGLIRPLGAKSEQKYPVSCPHCGEKIETEDTADFHLALKFIGVGFLVCIAGLIVLSALDKEQAEVFSHMSCVLGATSPQAWGSR